jgi:N-acetyl-beta-hexosaminidase
MTSGWFSGESLFNSGLQGRTAAWEQEGGKGHQVPLHWDSTALVKDTLALSWYASKPEAEDSQQGHSALAQDKQAFLSDHAGSARKHQQTRCRISDAMCKLHVETLTKGLIRPMIYKR